MLRADWPRLCLGIKDKVGTWLVTVISEAVVQSILVRAWTLWNQQQLQPCVNALLSAVLDGNWLEGNPQYCHQEPASAAALIFLLPLMGQLASWQHATTPCC